MNYLLIAGHLGADPEIRFTSTGKKVTTLRVATRTRRGNADDTIWYRVSVWGEQFDKMISFLKKGSAVIVCGELQKPEIFTDRDGKPQISMNITAVHLQFSPFGKPDRSTAHEGQHAAPTAGSPGDPINPYISSPMGAQPGKSPAATEEIIDDEVPF